LWQTNKPKSELPGLCGVINRSDMQNTLKKGPRPERMQNKGIKRANISSSEDDFGALWC
jgi:hypothetical protein